MLGRSRVKNRKTIIPITKPKKIIALNLLRKAWINLNMYRGDILNL